VALLWRFRNHSGEHMSVYLELLAQRQELDRQIEEVRKNEVAAAVRQVKDIIQEFGLTAAQCGFGSNSTAEVRRPAKAKYITPDGKTWTGRGKPPNVFKALVEAGHKMEEFLI
jgi:DNA-binding protein H-NS